MVRFLSKKIAVILVVAFTLWAVPPQVFADDDAQKIEDAQKLSDTLLILGVTLAIVAVVGGIVYGSIKRNKARNKKQQEEKKVNEMISDSLAVETPEL